MRRPALIATGSAVLLAASGALLTAAAPAAFAAGSTTLGEASNTGGNPQPTSAARTVFQHVAGAGAPSYAVPAGGGVITSWSVGLQGTTSQPTTIALEVGIPQGETTSEPDPTSYLIDSSDARTVPAQGASTVYSFPDAHVPVMAGSELGAWSSGPGLLTRPVSGSQIQEEETGNSHPSAPVQNQIISTGTINKVGGVVLEISAIVEPDADGDGFGDTTQDQCPADKEVHLAPCPAHLSTTVSIGQATSNGLPLTTVVQNTGTAGATDLKFSSQSTPGLAVLSAHSSQGTCSSPTSCSLGSLPVGQSVTIVQDLLPTASGSQSVTNQVSSTQPLLGTLGVTQLLEIEKGSVPKITVCKVPNVVGLTSAKAKSALSAAHCKAGFIKVAKLKRGQSKSQQRVLTQSSRKGQLLIKGGTVNLTVGVTKK